MEMATISSIVALVLLPMKFTVSFSSPAIMNGPQDTIVCMNAKPNFNCGFSGANPLQVAPKWRIVFRSDDGSVISNVTHSGYDIARGLINGLEWLPDLTSGYKNSPNSKLLVGPVNKSHNQSSYQCIITTVSGSVFSSVGTMTVTDPPSVIINVDEICTTSITISLNSYSHPACGVVSHNVTISDHVVYPNITGGSRYTIDELQSDTLYNITVTSTYNTGSRTFTHPVWTIPSQPPNAINIDSIKVMITSSDHMKMIFEPPLNDMHGICTMSTVKAYSVQVNSSQDHYAVTASVTVINSEGLHSDPTTKTVLLQNVGETVSVFLNLADTNTTSDARIILHDEIVIESPATTVQETNNNKRTKLYEKHSKLFMISTVVLFITSVITTTISIILTWKLCSQRKTNDAATISAPVQLERELNLDNINMQLSPAYVSLDNKRPRLYQNIESNNDNQGY